MMLTLATLGFALNFWAWALLSPLGPLFQTNGTLGDISESDVALLVAGCSRWFPVLFIGFGGMSSCAALLVGGTAFAVGVPFVSAWFPRSAVASSSCTPRCQWARLRAGRL